MNSQKHIFKLFLFFILTALSCNNDDSGFEEEQNKNGKLIESNGITEDDLETYQGELGISMSTRDIAKKGHKPTTAIFTVDSSSGDFGKSIVIDEDTNIAQLSFEVSKLSDEAVKELKSGVPVTVEIKDEKNVSLAIQSFTILSFESNPDNEEIEASGVEDIRDIKFRNGVEYYMQIVSEGQKSSRLVSFVNYKSGTYGVPVQLRDNYNFSETRSDKYKHQFTFMEIPNDPGYFAIISGVTSGKNHLFLRIQSGGYLYQDKTLHVEKTNLNNLPNQNRFKFKRMEDSGLFTINPKGASPLRKRIVNNATRLFSTSSGSYDIAYFRILTLDIDWDIKTLETRHLTPILPSASSQFENNSKLSNCTSGLLTQDFTLNRSETKTSQAAFEESFSMTSRETVGGSLTIGVETEASFFGTGATVSAEASATYEQETSITNTSTQYVSQTTEEEQSFSSNRTIEVPPGKAVNVYDAFQLYTDIKVPFIQRYRIRGTYQTGEGALNGDEIMTQFAFANANGGVVTVIGSDYIELTVRGVSSIGNIFKVTSKAEATDPDCN